MIKIFKSLTKKYSISIITSIHQPSPQIVSIFDFLYVLSKGGLCIYSGRPQHIRSHLNECDINCSEDQIPIEILLKIGFNGFDDQTVITLSDKTHQNMRADEERASHELMHSSNGIPIESKSFSFEELYHLFNRTIICFIRHKWKEFSIQAVIYLLIAIYIREHLDFDLDGPDSCIPKVSNSCAITPEFINNMKLMQYNQSYILLTLFVLITTTLCLSSIIFGPQLKVFFKEYRNRK